MKSLFVHEKFKRLVQLIIDGLSLHLFGHQVKNNVVDPQVQLLYCLLSVFSPEEEKKKPHQYSNTLCHEKECDV